MSISRFFLYTFLVCGMSNSFAAQAEPEILDFFIMSKSGSQYICERAIPFDPMGALKCRTTAYNGPFSAQQSETLCERSMNEAPALCGNEAYRGSFTTTDAIELCQHAKNAGPAECAEKAYRWPFFKSEVLTLCKGSGTVYNADCAIAAYNGRYSKTEAINICKNTN